jgi:hypothetical protein
MSRGKAWKVTKEWSSNTILAIMLAGLLRGAGRYVDGELTLRHQHPFE